VGPSIGTPEIAYSSGKALNPLSLRSHLRRSGNNESTKSLPGYQPRYIKDGIVISVIDEETLSSYRWSMAVIVGMVSQKGGVGKSTLSRLVAREYALAGWTVKIADLDVSQGTSFNWQSRRLQAGIEPVIPVERFGTVEQALKTGSHYDLLILDGPPHSTVGTLKIAAASLLTILPTGLSLDDLEPSVLLAHELRKREIKAAKIAFALSRVGESESEIAEARDYITQAGYRVLAGSLPEKTAYRRASDEGRSLTETRFPSLNRRSDELAQGIVDLITQMQKGMAA
jgi:chromosome partitioning protein